MHVYIDVLVVAHSMGGVVIRAAMALDNHPECAVSNIILLSSPNTRYVIVFQAPVLMSSSLPPLFVHMHICTYTYIYAGPVSAPIPPCWMCFTA